MTPGERSAEIEKLRASLVALEPSVDEALLVLNAWAALRGRLRLLLSSAA